MILFVQHTCSAKRRTGDYDVAKDSAGHVIRHIIDAHENHRRITVVLLSIIEPDTHATILGENLVKDASSEIPPLDGSNTWSCLIVLDKFDSLIQSDDVILIPCELLLSSRTGSGDIQSDDQRRQGAHKSDCQ